MRPAWRAPATSWHAPVCSALCCVLRGKWPLPEAGCCSFAHHRAGGGRNRKVSESLPVRTGGGFRWPPVRVASGAVVGGGWWLVRLLLLARSNQSP